jgi:quercetin dioxygenase-like cupin family protein
MCKILADYARANDRNAAAGRQPTAGNRLPDAGHVGPAAQQAGHPGTPPQVVSVMNHISHGSLAGDAQSHVFYGHEHGDIPISMFLVHNQPGDGPAPHRHPYAEVFVLHAGTGRFRLDDNELLASSGDIVIAPAGAAHGFTNVGPGELRMTCVHTAAEMNTVWVEPAAPRPATA